MGGTHNHVLTNIDKYRQQGRYWVEPTTISGQDSHFRGSLAPEIIQSHLMTTLMSCQDPITVVFTFYTFPLHSTPPQTKIHTWSLFSRRRTHLLPPGCTPYLQMWLNTSMSWLAAGPPTCTWPSPHPGISSRMSRRCCWPCPPWRRWRSGGSIPAPLLHTNRTDPLAATGLEQSAAHSGAGGGMGGRGAAKTLEEGRHQDAPCPSLKPLPKSLHSFCIFARIRQFDLHAPAPFFRLPPNFLGQEFSSNFTFGDPSIRSWLSVRNIQTGKSGLA